MVSLLLLLYEEKIKLHSKRKISEVTQKQITSSGNFIFPNHRSQQLNGQIYGKKVSSAQHIRSFIRFNSVLLFVVQCLWQRGRIINCHKPLQTLMINEARLMANNHETNIDKRTTARFCLPIYEPMFYLYIFDVWITHTQAFTNNSKKENQKKLTRKKRVR